MKLRHSIQFDNWALGERSLSKNWRTRQKKHVSFTADFIVCIIDASNHCPGGIRKFHNWFKQSEQSWTIWMWWCEKSAYWQLHHLWLFNCTEHVGDIIGHWHFLWILQRHRKYIVWLFTWHWNEFATSFVKPNDELHYGHWIAGKSIRNGFQWYTICFDHFFRGHGDTSCNENLLSHLFSIAIDQLLCKCEKYVNTWTLKLHGNSTLLFSINSNLFFLIVWIKLQEYLGIRFDKNIRIFGAILYIVQMSFYTAVSVYAPAIALNKATGLNTHVAVFLIYLVCIFYASQGGMKAVVIADTFQVK